MCKTVYCLFGILFGISFASAVSFLREPVNVTHAYHGNSGNFFIDCEVSHLQPEETVSWIKNGDIISDNYEFRSNVDRLVDTERYVLRITDSPLRFQLIVIPVSATTAVFDSGSYQCVVTSPNDNILPNGRSGTAVVNINDAYVPPGTVDPVCKIALSTGEEITMPPTTNVRYGDQLALTCLPNSPAPRNFLLFWSQNNRTSFLNNVSSGETSDDIVYIIYTWIPSSIDGSASTFTCTLQHPSLLSYRTCIIKFNIQYAPVATIYPTDVMVTEENDEIVLHCNQDANPQVTETVWYYDDGVVNSGGRFRLEGMSLRILAFSSIDNGDHTITCELTNLIGKGSDSVILTVDVQYSSTKIKTVIDNTQTTTMCQEYRVSERVAVTNNIGLSIGLFCAGLILGVVSTAAVCYFMNKRDRMERRYGNSSNLADSVKSRDDIELNTESNLGIESDMTNDDEQNYQVIKEHDATTVKAREENKVTDTGNYTNIPSRQFTGEDEHYQSLGKQSDNVYTGLTTDNKI